MAEYLKIVNDVSGIYPHEGTEKVKPTFILKVKDRKIAVLPFFFCISLPY